jgi:hypothetical protein
MLELSCVIALVGFRISLSIAQRKEEVGKQKSKK